MARYALSISTEARDQLWAAAQWYAETSGSSEVAMRWLEGFSAVLDSLRSNPHRCGLAHENGEFSYELREILYGSGRRKTHRALFRVVELRVEVLAIRHLAQQDVTSDDFANQ